MYLPNEMEWGVDQTMQILQHSIAKARLRSASHNRVNSRSVQVALALAQPCTCVWLILYVRASNNSTLSSTKKVSLLEHCTYVVIESLGYRWCCEDRPSSKPRASLTLLPCLVSSPSLPHPLPARHSPASQHSARLCLRLRPISAARCAGVGCEVPTPACA